MRLTFQSSKSHQQEIFKHVILQKLPEDHAAGSAAVNAAFGNPTFPQEDRVDKYKGEPYKR